jgi:hypothetical protein
MKATNNSEMENENIFGKALERLMNAVRNKYSRKDWTSMLGISEAAVSQWIKGKTFPAADKLEMIITVLSSQDFNSQEQQAYDAFMALLESPAASAWPKLRDDLINKKLSDYVLQSDTNALNNNISGMFYDLKLALYQDINRQIDIHTNHLCKLLLNEVSNNEDSFYEISVRHSKLMSAFTSAVNRKVLHDYTTKVQSVYSFFNILLEKLLSDKAGHSDPEVFRDLILKVFDQEKDQLCSQLAKKSKVLDDVPTLDDYLEIKKQKNARELSFFMPRTATSDVHSHLKKSGRLLHVSLKNSSRAGKISLKIEGEHLMPRTRGSDPQKNYLLNFDLDLAEKTTTAVINPSVETTIESFYQVFSERQSGRRSIKTCFLSSQVTNERYSVEILGAVNAKTQKISDLNNSIIFVLFGHIELITEHSALRHRSKPLRLGSFIEGMGNTFGNHEEGCYFACIQDDHDYTIKNNGGDYIALLIKDFQGLQSDCFSSDAIANLL